MPPGSSRTATRRPCTGFSSPFEVILCFILIYSNASGVKIDRLSVPSSVENGTTDSVVLDCIYSYTYEDQQLVVKWFFNQDPKPIYQWIPDLKRRSYSSKSGFDGHINRHYAVSQDPHTRYRALNILRPTTAMSGTYSCSVTSLQGQDTKAADMIVYAKPKKFDLSFQRPAHSEETQFRCQVEGIFPEPQVLMYRVEQMHIAGNEYLNVDNMTQLNYSVQPVALEANVTGPKQLELKSPNDQQHRAAKEGYSTVLTTSLSNQHFRSHASARHLFFCVYSIPSTDIKQTRVLEFYPERYISGADGNNSISISVLALWMTCWVLVNIVG